MRISELLISMKLVTVEDIEKAEERQASAGGFLTESLLALDILPASTLEDALRYAPTSPMSPAETGLNSGALMELLAKTIYTHRTETIGDIRDTLQLPTQVIAELLKEGIRQKLFEEYGSDTSAKRTDIRYRVTQFGKEFAEESLEQNRYAGAAPVPLETYREQALAQTIGNEFVNPERVEKAFSELVITEAFLRRLGPALNSGKSMLLYGPPGNGKSTIAEIIGVIHENVIFVPHAIEVGGDIITVYDPRIHTKIEDVRPRPAGSSVRREEEVDRRWVPCRRPLIIAGGELTLEMLDLKFNETAKYYEAPLHIKAQGGVFLVDDFGRQLVQPEELLNRWVVPLGRRIDFLKLQSGKQFEIPFDQLTIFSTNLEPDDLMDPAALRRVPYKVEVDGPTEAEFTEIFARVCKTRGIPYQDRDMTQVIETLTNANGFEELARYQVEFIIDHIIDYCRYAGREPDFDPVIVGDAVANMFAQPSRMAQPIALVLGSQKQPTE